MNTKAQHFHANFSRAKLLLIEDSDDQWVIIEKALQKSLSEVTVQRVPTADQAITVVAGWRNQERDLPKLILLDLYLPQKQDGWQLLRQLKAQPTGIGLIPIVIFSSSEAKSDIETSYQLGASSYLVKPLTYGDWVAYFQALRAYWWETVTLPPTRYSL